MTRAATLTLVSAIQQRIDARDHSGALELIREIPSCARSALGTTERLTVDVFLAECFAFLGRPSDSVALCRRAIRSLQGGCEHALYARACFVTAVAKHYLGEIDGAVECTRSALYSYKRADDVAGVIRSLNWLGNALFYKADYENALDSYRQSIVLASKHKMRRSVAVGRDNMGRLLLLMGQLHEARRAFRGNEHYYRQVGEELGIARHTLSMAYLSILRRDFRNAERLLNGLESKKSICAHVREHGAWLEYMGELRLLQDRPIEAAQLLESAIGLSDEKVGVDESLVGQSRRLLAEVRLAQGDLNEALAECDRALVSIRKVGERFEEGVVYRVIAEVHARRGETEAAIEGFRKSVDILRTIGARLEWAKTCLAAGRGSLFGERERLAYLFEAERLFADVGVAYWSEQTSTALAGILKEMPVAVSRQISTVRDVSSEPVIIAAGGETAETLDMARRWAQKDLAILITGETGTGKDLLARYIHAVSPRREGPFVDIDLNNIPDTLWESQLFGHRKGSFTGAWEEKPGLLESASGGTVFLNEIGNLPLELQGRLLEFLDTRQVRRLGSMQPVTLDVRFVAATNRDLREAVEHGLFRSDLYFRLEQAPLHLAPLRERREDILPLIHYFLAELGVTGQSLQTLARQPWVERAVKERWPGNIRQLLNFLDRLVTITGYQIDAECALWADRLMNHLYISGNGNGNGKGHGNGNGNGNGDGAERTLFKKTLEQHAWNQRATARDLEMSEGNVRYLIRRWQIEKPAEGELVEQEA